MNRIETIYSYIDVNDKVIDIGCDQAKLGLMLAKRKQKSIASDVSINVIERASYDIGHNEYIELRVSNGLEKIDSSEVDTAVLSGMGTHTIIDILKNTNIRFKKIITISNNYHDILRSKMNELNYRVASEEIIKENDKYYNLILFVPGKSNYTKTEILLGINHKNIEMYQEYLEYLLNKYKIIKKSSKNRNNKVDEMLLEINNRLENL